MYGFPGSCILLFPLNAPATGVIVISHGSMISQLNLASVGSGNSYSQGW